MAIRDCKKHCLWLTLGGRFSQRKCKNKHIHIDVCGFKIQKRGITVCAKCDKRRYRHCWHKMTKEPRKNSKCYGGYPEYVEPVEFGKSLIISECCRCARIMPKLNN